MPDALGAVGLLAVGLLYAQLAQLLPAPLAYRHNVLAVLLASHSQNNCQRGYIKLLEKKGLNNRESFYH